MVAHATRASSGSGTNPDVFVLGFRLGRVERAEIDAPAVEVDTGAVRGLVTTVAGQTFGERGHGRDSLRIGNLS